MDVHYGTVDLTVDNMENLYFVGAYSDPTTFDQDPITLVPGQLRTSFIVKYTSAGSVDWVFSPDNNADATTDIETLKHDAAGNIYVVGSFTDSLTLGSTSFYNADAGVNQGDFFITRFSPMVSTGISEPSNVSFSVTPNPGSGEYLLSTGMQDYNATLFNVTGSKVWERKMQSGNTKIDITELPAGLYFLQLQDGKEMKTVRVVKK
jgi:hypothetical protein